MMDRAHDIIGIKFPYQGPHKGRAAGDGFSFKSFKYPDIRPVFLFEPFQFQKIFCKPIFKILDRKALLKFIWVEKPVFGRGHVFADAYGFKPFADIGLYQVFEAVPGMAAKLA
jgi:hypothetical protein